MYAKALSGKLQMLLCGEGWHPRMIATTDAHNRNRHPLASRALSAEEYRDALDLVASGVDASRVSAGPPVDAVPGAVAGEEAV
jgi:hypothetical protein